MLKAALIITGDLMINKEYLSVIIDIANKKLAENLRRIKLFDEKCKQQIFTATNSTNDLKGEIEQNLLS